ncbi:MAG: hypothetical protein M5U22_15220 [Thermoleophilia bacterium]|nr:hypothetical protein [Thermoleophilia bacterium]
MAHQDLVFHPDSEVRPEVGLPGEDLDGLVLGHNALVLAAAILLDHGIFLTDKGPVVNPDTRRGEAGVGRVFRREDQPRGFDEIL